MKHPIKLNPEKYFTDPDMPFFGYPKTESNIAAVKQLWEDAHPKAIADCATSIMYGTPGTAENGHQALMTMFFDEGYYL